MTDAPTGSPTPAEPAEPVEPELVLPEEDDGAAQEHNNVAEPAKVMRVGTMIRQLLDEVRQTEMDGPSRDRLREIYETSIREISAAVSPDLRD